MNDEQYNLLFTNFDPHHSPVLENYNALSATHKLPSKDLLHREK